MALLNIYRNIREINIVETFEVSKHLNQIYSITPRFERGKLKNLKSNRIGKFSQRAEFGTTPLNFF